MSAPSLSEDRTTSSYRVSLVKIGEGPEAAWVAELEDEPGNSARGATPEEAVARVWAAANGLPQRSRGEVRRAAEAPQHSGKLLVRMPATLHDELAQIAEHEGVSLNQLITGALAGAVAWRAGEIRHEAASTDDRASGRWTLIALVANFAVLLTAAILAITVLIAAWQGGL